MRPCRAAAAALLATVAILASAAPATAERLPLTDEAGDTPQRGLDITDVVFSNRDRAVVSRLTFAEDRPGTVIVNVKARHGSGVYVVSQHARVGPDQTFLFTRDGGEVRCEGLFSSWDRDNARLRLRLPARCLDAGNYGAVRHWALTETRDGGDVDYAPENSEGELIVTDWISRG